MLSQRIPSRQPTAQAPRCPSCGADRGLVKVVLEAPGARFVSQWRCRDAAACRRRQAAQS